jgi:hypothetical protein
MPMHAAACGQAISTKYLGPTNHHGSRVLVKCQAERIVVSWNCALGGEQNHFAAAEVLAKKLGWDTYGNWIGAGSPDGSGYTFVCVEK